MGVTMTKCFCQNVALGVNETCNLNCDHCCKAGSHNRYIIDDVISSTFNQIYVGNLSLCGGELTLALKKVEKILTYIVDNHKWVEELSLTINGTKYSQELLDLLNYFDEYLANISEKKQRIYLDISYDQYHLKEINKLQKEKEFLENIKKYQESKFFDAFRGITGKLFREGNALNLPRKLTVPLRPMKTFMTYDGGLCNIGPIVHINTRGTICETDTTYEKQQTKFNYGNILTDSIEEIVRKKSRVLKTKEQYLKCCYKAVDKFKSYKH